MSKTVFLSLNGLALVAFCVHAGGDEYATPTKMSYAFIFLSVMAISYLMGLILAEICRRSGRVSIRKILGHILLPALPYLGLLNRTDEVGLLVMILAIAAIVATSLLFSESVADFDELVRINGNLDSSLDAAAKSTAQFYIALIFYAGSAAISFDFLSRYAN